MAPDLRPGPHSPPTDELHSAEDTLGVLRQVLHTVAGDDMSRQTPCTQFTVAQLTDHLLNSIRGIGGMAGAPRSLRIFRQPRHPPYRGEVGA